MKLAIRADASAAIGSGHIVRCLTLAQTLRGRGHAVVFICRDLPGNLNGLLRDAGFAVAQPDGPHDAAADSAQTLAVLDGTMDWIVVDHYGLGQAWEHAVRRGARRVMALEDQATRPHDCDLLLDQNLSQMAGERYTGLLAPGTLELTGPEWALVRPEFATLREASLARRQRPAPPRHLMLFLGGGDVLQDTLRALEGVRASGVGWARIDVVVGLGCPGLGRLEDAVAAVPGARLHVQTDAMAQLMLEADVALTAGGSVSWEKCCMGLPSIVAVLADNQAGIASALMARGAAISLGQGAITAEGCASALASLDSGTLSAMSLAASQVCDGRGAAKVARELEKG